MAKPRKPKGKPLSEQEPPTRFRFVGREDPAVPMLANIVDVGGSAAAIEIAFAYVHGSALGRADESPPPKGVRRHGSVAEIEVEEVASVVLGVTDAVQLAMDIIVHVVENVDHFQEDMDRIAKTMSTLSNLATGSDD